jgi:hypothetical protein
MKQNEVAPRYQKLLRCFTHLPQQILSLHEIDNVAEYVLHSLCDEGCLDISKAAYFIDNPDFDCLKGIAGFDKSEEVHSCEIELDDKGQFKDHMNMCAFNKRVRTINIPSLKRTGETQDKIALHLGGVLGMENPAFHSWGIKHDNHGLLIFERSISDDNQLNQEFLRALSILGFCPIS